MCLRDVQGVRESVQAIALQHVIILVKQLAVEIVAVDALHLVNRLVEVQVDIK